MKCSQFILDLEDYLGRHLDEAVVEISGPLDQHARVCPRCQQRWQTAVRSRSVLASLRVPADGAAPAADPYFYTRLRARLDARETRPSRLGLQGFQVAGRDLALAGVLFAATLGSFLYNFHHTESPNANEAMVLDVPHLNPQHPSDDHRAPQLADAMANLMNP